MTSQPLLTRKRLIELLNRDLACEYRAIMAYIVYSEVLKRASYTGIAEELERHAADEFQHAKGIAKQITYLGGVPCAMLKAARPTSGPGTLCHTEADNDVITVGNHRYPINPAGAPEGLDVRDALRAILAQEHEHEMNLAAALGMDVLPPALIRPATPGRPQQKPTRGNAPVPAPRMNRSAAQATSKPVPAKAKQPGLGSLTDRQ